MKHVNIILFVALSMCAVKAQTHSDSLDCLAAAFIDVESRGHSSAIGDGGRSVGVLQLRKIMVDEANRLVGIPGFFAYEDRLDSLQSVEIFKVIMSVKNPTLSVSRACSIWNPRHSTTYYEKVNTAYQRRLAQRIRKK